MSGRASARLKCHEQIHSILMSMWKAILVIGPTVPPFVEPSWNVFVAFLVEGEKPRVVIGFDVEGSEEDILIVHI
ncbi:hypothetical protein Bca4012_027115 [Brassica carinata]